MPSSNKEIQNAFSGSTTDASISNKELKEVIGGGKRLASLDLFRGLVMVLLMLEASKLYYHWGEMRYSFGRPSSR